jgi:hypothetical protein
MERTRSTDNQSAESCNFSAVDLVIIAGYLKVLVDIDLDQKEDCDDSD